MNTDNNGRETVSVPTVFVLFGGSGDLAWRKLIPALYSLFKEGALPETFAIRGLGRSNQDDKAFRAHLHDGVNQFSRLGPANDKEWDDFSSHIGFFQGDFTDPAAYKDLAKHLDDIDKDWHTKASHIFYMATPPSMFGQIATMLGEAGLVKDRERSRIVVEKPIGHDLDSAMALDQTLNKYFKEFQIFRIDHYLGKETVQNILAFRFANPLFEPIWDRRYIDYVAITVAEEVGVGHRGDYYDKAGALRDMIQNHLMQLMCLVAMEPPVSFQADEIRNKKVDVLHAIRPIAPTQVSDCAVRGQYGPGWIEGQPVQGYRETEGIAPQSGTDTFAAVKLFVDNWRWQGVPFYLRTGKCLSKKVSEIAIRFKMVPHQAFPKNASLNWQPAQLNLCIQPDEGIVMSFQAKRPGSTMHLQPVDMRFCYKDTFNEESPEAYETLLWDIMIGDQTLFMRADQVEASWKIFMPILNAWSAIPPDNFPNYAAGSDGPDSANQLVAMDGHSWPHPVLLQAQPHETEKPEKPHKTQKKEVASV